MKKAPLSARSVESLLSSREADLQVRHSRHDNDADVDVRAPKWKAFHGALYALTILLLASPLGLAQQAPGPESCPPPPPRVVRTMQNRQPAPHHATLDELLKARAELETVLTSIVEKPELKNDPAVSAQLERLRAQVGDLTRRFEDERALRVAAIERVDVTSVCKPSIRISPDGEETLTFYLAESDEMAEKKEAEIARLNAEIERVAAESPDSPDLTALRKQLAELRAKRDDLSATIQTLQTAAFRARDPFEVRIDYLADARQSMETQNMEFNAIRVGNRIREETVPEKKAQLTEELRKLLNDLFDKKQAANREQLKELQERVTQMQSTLDSREQNRGQIIDRRFHELTGQADEYDW